MRKKPLVSVIIPIYNVEDYLSRCLDSVIGQTYGNLEIILVNDGSTDGSRKICESYKKKDKRVVVIDKKNGGLSEARNVAIDRAKGEYLFFLDSDDYINKDIILRLYNNLDKNKADIATTGYIAFSGVEPVLSIRDEMTTGGAFKRQDALEKLMYQEGCTNSAWGKLYKAELFKDIRYPIGKICEDLPTTYLLFAKSNSVYIGLDRLYYYFNRSDSIINSRFDARRMDALEFAEEETEYITKKFPDIKNSAICREFMESIFILLKLYGQCNDGFKKEYSIVKKSIKKNRRVVLFDKKAPKKVRICAGMCFVGVKFTQIVLAKKHRKKTGRI